jgi:CBS domain containing-hemolysin-like protein
MAIILFMTCTLALTAGLIVAAYFDRVYRDLGRTTAGRVREHLDTFEAEIEPRLKLERIRAAVAFNLLARLWLAALATVTVIGVMYLETDRWQIVLEIVLLLGAEVVLAMQLLPMLLVAGTSGRWASPMVPLVQLELWILWPILAVLDLAVSVLRISEDEPSAPVAEHQAIEALVDAATEEGIIEQDEARLIEQVVEFGDKRVRDMMTPRPDVVAISARASLEELRRRVVETKFSRLPVYDKTMDDITGMVVARDMLEVPDRDAARRTVRELMRPALFVPEMKFGSELLKELQRKNQQMAIVIDEYGLLAGVVTIEDLVEEIVGEIGEEDRRPAPDVIREAGGSMVVRGSVGVEKVAELFGVTLESAAQHSNVSTIAGLLNGVAGHVPRTGEVVEFDGLRFDVLEANQRKVLRVRARRLAAAPISTARAV